MLPIFTMLDKRIIIAIRWLIPILLLPIAKFSVQLYSVVAGLAVIVYTLYEVPVNDQYTIGAKRVEKTTHHRSVSS